ncbi:PepSY domain-containing protein [Gemmobacter serpentinus]|uniref:PepSY domain-containing protein n=1 Tax=Gemmobacter serpentinus TaxID=2652247 RepID=UPI00124C40FD|nr:PepSY domain-containing protein [Gemmobacter serpentinus]
MIRNITRRFGGAVFTAALAAPVLTGPALAATETPMPSFASTMQRIEAQGFRIVEADLDDGNYEIEAYGQDGRKVELRVDVASGDILRRKNDD